MQPGAAALGNISKFGYGIEITSIDLAGVADNDRGFAQIGQLPIHCGQIDSSDRIGSAHLDRISPMAEHLQGLASTGVYVSPGEHRHATSDRDQPLAGDIDAVLLPPPVGSACQTGEIGKGCAAYQGSTPGVGQPNKFA